MAVFGALDRPLIIPHIREVLPVKEPDENGNGTYITPAWILKWGLPTVVVFLAGQWLLINSSINVAVQRAVADTMREVDSKYVSSREYDTRWRDAERRFVMLEAADRAAQQERVNNAAKLQELQVQVERLRAKNGDK